MAHAQAPVLMTGLAALVFAATFAFGARIHPLRVLMGDRRSQVSFSAGMSAAYVFVRLMPELSAARVSFAESVSATLRYEGKSIYFVALLGFLAFYALDHLRTRTRMREVHESGTSSLAFRLHIGGFAAYVTLVAYLLVRNLEEGSMAMALYAVAIAFHFLAVDHALNEEHGAAYQSVGRWVLAGMCVLGWTLGLAVALPAHILALLLALLSGAVIMNSALMELSPENKGRFLPFLCGGLAYGLLLLPLD
jgi:hypothetical protein